MGYLRVLNTVFEYLPVLKYVLEYKYPSGMYFNQVFEFVFAKIPKISLNITSIINFFK